MHCALGGISFCFVRGILRVGVVSALEGQKGTGASYGWSNVNISLENGNILKPH